MRIGFLSLIMLLSTLCTAADDYPNKPVRIVVGFPPSTATDVVARVISQQLADQLGKTFVVENRPGASGNIGAELAAKSSPDGYTLFLYSATNTATPSLFKSLPFDMDKGFTPITLIIRSPLGLVVRPTLNVNTLKELIALAQANPGKLNYGSAGIGSAIHLSTELFKGAAKVNITHIPYSTGGAAAVITAMLGDQVEMLLTTLPTVLPFVRANRLRALAVTTDGKRVASLPNVPSMIEAGIPGMTVYFWFGLAAPAGTPKPVVNKLYSETRKALESPAVKTRLLADDAELVGSTPEEFATLIRSEIRRWGEVVKTAGIKPE